MKNILAAIMLAGTTVSVEALDKSTREYEFAQLHDDIVCVLEEILPKIDESQEDAKQLLADFSEWLAAKKKWNTLLSFPVKVIRCDTPTELDSIYIEFTRQFSSINAKDYLEAKLRRSRPAITAYELQYEVASVRSSTKCLVYLNEPNKQGIDDLIARLKKKFSESFADRYSRAIMKNIQPYPQPFAQLSICHPEFIDSARLNALHFKAIWSELKQHYHSDDCRPGGKCHKHISDILEEISATSQESAYKYYWALLNGRITQVNDDEDKQLQDLFSALHYSINMANLNGLSATNNDETLNAIRVLIAQYIEDGIFTSKSAQNNHGAIQAVNQVLDTLRSRIPYTQELETGLQTILASNKTIHDKIDDMYHLIENICGRQRAAKLADTLEQLTKAQS